MSFGSHFPLYHPYIGEWTTTFPMQYLVLLIYAISWQYICCHDKLFQLQRGINYFWNILCWGNILGGEPNLSWQTTDREIFYYNYHVPNFCIVYFHAYIHCTHSCKFNSHTCYWQMLNYPTTERLPYNTKWNTERPNRVHTKLYTCIHLQIRW